MALYDIQIATAAVPLVFPLNSTASGNPPLTGASPTVVLSKNGAVYASPAGAVSEIGGGLYKVAANAVDSNTLGILWLHATATGAVPQDVVYGVVPPPIVVGAAFAVPASQGDGSTLDTTDGRVNLVYPRDTQKSFVLYFPGGPITGRTIAWFLKTGRQDSAPVVLTHTVGDGAIVMNSVPVTLTVVINGVPTVVTAAPNQLATLTIGDGDCTDPTVFKSTGLWHAFHVDGPEEVPIWGTFRIIDEP